MTTIENIIISVSFLVISTIFVLISYSILKRQLEEYRRRQGMWEAKQARKDLQYFHPYHNPYPTTKEYDKHAYSEKKYWGNSNKKDENNA